MNRDVPANVPKNVPINRQEKIIHMMQENSAITIDQLAHACGVSDKTIKRDIARLKEEERVARSGSVKSGHWHVQEKKIR